VGPAVSAATSCFPRGVVGLRAGPHGRLGRPGPGRAAHRAERRGADAYRRSARRCTAPRCTWEFLVPWRQRPGRLRAV